MATLVAPEEPEVPITRFGLYIGDETFNMSGHEFTKEEVREWLTKMIEIMTYD